MHLELEEGGDNLSRGGSIPWGEKVRVFFGDSDGPSGKLEVHKAKTGVTNQGVGNDK